MFTSRGFRLSAIFLSLFLAFATLGVGTAEARFGGSFGSRGTRTFQSVPSTGTMPGVTAPVQRSMTNGSSIGNTGIGSSAYRPGLFGGFGGIGGWLVGGLLFSGLFGMMFGGGFGGFGGVLSLIVQGALIYFIVRWLFRRFAGPRMANATAYDGGGSYGGNTSGYGFGSQPNYGRQTSEASQRAGRRDEIGIGPNDLKIFEERLGQLQDSYSREDYDALRRISTPEMMSYLTEELAQAAAKGLRNEVFDVKLLSGDIAESWREGDREYATIALRYESRDVMRERATGKLVSGEDRIMEHSEAWTFVRERRGDWILSAIQGA